MVSKRVLHTLSVFYTRSPCFARSATLSEEIAALQKEIKALDTAVAEATEQRKSEHAAFVQAQAENQAATALVEKAKNRLFKVRGRGGASSRRASCVLARRPIISLWDT